MLFYEVFFYLFWILGLFIFFLFKISIFGRKKNFEIFSNLKKNIKKIIKGKVKFLNHEKVANNENDRFKLI